MRMSRRSAVALAAMVLAAGEGRAQEFDAIPDARTTPIGAIISQFTREVSTPPARRSNAEPAMLAILMQRTEIYSASRVDSLIAGLENLATSQSASVYARAKAAALLITAAGSDSRRPLHDGVERIQDVYEANAGDAIVRGTILSMTYRLADRGQTLEWLTNLVTAPPAQQTYPHEGQDAVRAMLGLGDVGRSRLRQLENENRIRDSRAAALARGLLDRAERAPR